MLNHRKLRSSFPTASWYDLNFDANDIATLQRKLDEWLKQTIEFSGYRESLRLLQLEIPKDDASKRHRVGTTC